MTETLLKRTYTRKSSIHPRHFPLNPSKVGTKVVLSLMQMYMDRQIGTVSTEHLNLRLLLPCIYLIFKKKMKKIFYPLTLKYPNVLKYWDT